MKIAFLIDTLLRAGGGKSATIADRNPLKVNSYTPGSKFMIKSKKFSRKLNPDFYLVLSWHFKNEILKRDKKIKSKGTKFIFPSPNIEVK